MTLTATFRALDDDAEDHVIGTVTWDGTAATAAPPGHEFLKGVAAAVRVWPDPAAAMRELPLLYKSAYLRAELAER